MALKDMFASSSVKPNRSMESRKDSLIDIKVNSAYAVNGSQTLPRCEDDCPSLLGIQQQGVQ